MKKHLYFFLILFSFVLNAQEKPKLVVGIVVDQMKTEYLYRFSNDFSNNGFKKLMAKGFTFHNMHYNYMPTYTAPGHAAIFTGALPNVNGIVGNDWFNKATGKEMYCTDDASVSTLVEGTESEGKMSPKNLFSTTITDELLTGRFGIQKQEILSRVLFMEINYQIGRFNLMKKKTI
jgi:predicted AlkP superfamily pyrophosphatase or phosphodiesterase